MLITAKEAIELVEQSKVIITKRLEQISNKIREAATLGKREIYLTDLNYHEDWVKVDYVFYRTPEFTPIQRQIEQELKQLGFTMSIVMREVKIGGGLGSIDDAPKIENRPYIVIKW